MRLFEAIIEANQRALRGDKSAGVRIEEYAAALPLVMLTCVDPRLNPLIPEVMGVPEEKVIWLRNAGNIITGPLSSTMRSLALACLVKEGREIAIIGHTDCLVGKATMLKLTDAMKALGVERARLPENLVEYFGMFSSERQNVLKAVDFVRASPLIGASIPVHGLLLDTQSGSLDWLVNGYQAMDSVTSKFTSAIRKAETVTSALEDLPDFKIGGLELPTSKIGEVASKTGELLQKIEDRAEQIEAAYHKARETIGQEKSNTLPPSLAPEAETDLRQKIDTAKRYVLIGGDQKRYGPIPGRIVLQWLDDGRIDASTPIQVEGVNVWQTLGTLPSPRATGKLPLPPPIEPRHFKKKY